MVLLLVGGLVGSKEEMKAEPLVLKKVGQMVEKLAELKVDSKEKCLEELKAELLEHWMALYLVLN